MTSVLALQRNELRDRLTVVEPAASGMLAALKELANVSRSYIAHMDADDIVALEAARAAIAQAEAAGVK